MQQQSKGFDPSPKESFNIAYGLMKCQATCVTPFIRTGFGSEALGLPALGALVAFALWTMGTQAVELETALLCWFFAIALQRLRMLAEWWKGYYRHSRDDGWSFLTGWFCRNETLSKFIEGVAVFAFGVWLEDNPLGSFLMASGAAIVALEFTNFHYYQKQEQSRRDAIIEMQAMGHNQWERRM